MRFLARRTVHSLILMLAVSVLSFLFADLAPGDFYSALRADPRISPETIAALRARAGLDKPLPVRYAEWVISAVRGDFGYSLAYNSPVGPLLWGRARATLLLAATAMAITWLIAIPVGVWNASSRGKWRDRV